MLSPAVKVPTELVLVMVSSAAGLTTTVSVPKLFAVRLAPSQAQATVTLLVNVPLLAALTAKVRVG